MGRQALVLDGCHCRSDTASRQHAGMHATASQSVHLLSAAAKPSEASELPVP